MIYALSLTLLKCLMNEVAIHWTCPVIKKMLIHKAVEGDQLRRQRRRSKNNIKIGFQVYNFG